MSNKNSSKLKVVDDVISDGINDFFSSLSEAIAFDDVLIRPTYTEVLSRSYPSTITNVAGFDLSTPLISSPMDSVTEYIMAIEMSRLGGFGVIHRFMPIEDQLFQLSKMIDYEKENDIKIKKVFAVGVGDDEFERAVKLMESGVNSFVIDVANGHSPNVRNMIKRLRDEVGSEPLSITAGSIATGDGYSYLADSGANAVRVGIGGGSICKTRIQTGIGVPTLYSVAEASKARQMMQDRSTSIIADGGIRYPADLVKSIVAGADAVICGRIFAGTEETPGEVLELEAGKFCKIYAGMASKEVQERRRGGLKKDTCAEGTETIVPFNGKVEYVVSEFLGGLRSAMTYVGAENLLGLRLNSQFIKISRASLEESHSFGTKK